MGLLRHRTGCLTAARNNGFLRAVTGVTVQRAGHDHGQALQGAFHGLVTSIFHAHTGGSPGVHHLGVPILSKPLNNRVGNRGAHTVHSGKAFTVSLADRLHRTELRGERAGSGRAHVANREGNQHTPQRLLLCFLQLGEEVQRILRGLRLGACLGRLGVEVGHALHLSGAHTLDLLLTFDGDLAQVLNVEAEQVRLGR